MDNWINTAQIGDNLEIMKNLPSNSIDLIYCDILYGTGRDFGDYKDLRANKKEIEAFYIPRIKEMHRLLKNTGSIYLQMDTRINHWVRCIMDDVFEYSNFLNEIINQTKRPANDKKSIRNFSKKTDVIIFYSKSKKYFFEPVFDKLSSIEIQKRFRKKDKNGFFESVAIEHIKSNPRFNLVYEYKGYKPTYGWHMTKDKLTDLDEKGLLFFTKNGKPRRKRYLDDRVNSSNVWSFLNLRGKYPTQKPKALLERIIKASSKEGDIVADFFCGSGTTAEVANELNRNYFVCDINPKAIEITNSRLKSNLFSAV